MQHCVIKDQDLLVLVNIKTGECAALHADEVDDIVPLLVWESDFHNASMEYGDALSPSANSLQDGIYKKVVLWEYEFSDDEIQHLAAHCDLVQRWAKLT